MKVSSLEDSLSMGYTKPWLLYCAPWFQKFKMNWYVHTYLNQTLKS
ncbi:hypothetical protein GALL_545770 [mine drainage metagenome]|uniref:Uncharacterized protein n=1 Tax=mine drainage metagenome TaxID=410659 RepID=A0A1J5P7V6_9ZZZZ